MNKLFIRINQLKNASAKHAEYVSLQRGYFDIATISLSTRNFSYSQKTKHKLPYRLQMLNILKNQGYIRFFTINPKGRSVFVTVYLKYTAQGESALRNISLISTPGRSLYVSNQSFWQPLSNTGLLILSTSRGLLTDREARKSSLGGKVLLVVT